jgi:hypothetical protein
MKHGQVFNDNFPSVFRFLVSLGMTSSSEKKGRERDGSAVPLPAFTPILQTVIPTEGRNLNQQSIKNSIFESAPKGRCHAILKMGTHKKSLPGFGNLAGFYILQLTTNVS